jgi:hypothetical protein
MKKVIVFLILGFSLVSCSEDDAVTFNTDPALTPYVEKFFTEAEEHGVSLERNLIAKLGYIQGITQSYKGGDQNFLTYKEEQFNMHSDIQRQAFVCFELGKLFLGRSYEDKPGTFMRLFTVYDPADEEAMFDELFQ